MAAALAPMAAALIVPVYEPPISLNGGFLPKKLSTSDREPITLSVGGMVSALSDPRSVALREVTIDLDKNGAVDPAAFSACGRSKLESPGASVARICPKAIVGAGVAKVHPSSGKGSMKIPMTLVNGGSKAGVTTLLIDAPMTAAAPSAVVAVVKIRSIHRGRYGLEAVARVLPAAEAIGPVRSFDLTFTRSSSSGMARSFALARCPDRHLSAEVTGYLLSNGERYSEDRFVRPCRPSEG